MPVPRSQFVPPPSAGAASAAAVLAATDPEAGLSEARKAQLRESPAYWLGRAEQRDEELALRAVPLIRAAAWRAIARQAIRRLRRLRTAGPRAPRRPSPN